MAVDMFLKLDDIKGESLVAGHEGEIEVLSFSWGETNAGPRGSGGGAGAGRVMMQDLHFVKHEDHTSPTLFLKCAMGAHIKWATLMVREGKQDSPGANSPDPAVFFEIKLSDVLISGFEIKGELQGLTEAVSLNFSKIELTDWKGEDRVSAGWDIKSQQKV
jgi:type VI secretion system secreted protein Hcp